MTLHADVTRRVAEAAAEHHGAVRTAELRGLGISTTTIQRHVAAGLLVPRDHGLLVVPSLTDRWIEVLIAVSRSARLAAAHSVAAALYGWDGLDRPSPSLLAHPTLVSPWSSRPDLRPYRRKDFTLADICVEQGIRVASPLWTLRHLEVAPDLLESAVESSLRAGQVSEEQLWCGAGPRLLTVLERRGRGAPPTESMLETLTVQRVLRPAAIPVLGRQVDILQYRVDFLLAGWTVLEVDGADHATPDRKRADDRRDLEMAAVGLQVARTGWAEVRSRARGLATRLQQVVAVGQAVHGGVEPRLDGRRLRI